jgi:hypothetical protein
LFVLSPEAVQSAWTRKEWTAALAREIEESRIRLGVLLLRNCNVLELLRTKHRFDARTDPARAIREVVDWAKRMRDQRKLADSKAPRFFLGYDPRDFVGRERYFERLHAALMEQPGVFLLHGEPGSGKSTLALKFAWKAVRSEKRAGHFNDRDVDFSRITRRRRQSLEAHASPCSPNICAASSTGVTSPALRSSVGARSPKRGFLLTKNTVCIHSS